MLFCLYCCVLACNLYVVNSFFFFPSFWVALLHRYLHPILYLILISLHPVQHLKLAFIELHPVDLKLSFQFTRLGLDFDPDLLEPNFPHVLIF